MSKSAEKRGGLVMIAEPLPRWLELPLKVALCLFVSFGVSGVGLAIAGWFRPASVLAVTAVVTAGMLRLSRPWVGPSRDVSWHWPSVLAVVFVLAFTGIQFRYAGEHVLLDRDPGAYVNTARHLASTGGLVVDARVGAFAEVRGTSFEAPAFEEHGEPGVLYPQFLHLLPVLMAAGAWVGDSVVLLKVPALLGGIGLLTIYAFASRFLQPWWALMAMVALGLNLAYVHFSRDAYSEIPTIMAIFGGLFLLWEAIEDQHPGTALVAGLLLGMTVMARIDSILYLSVLTIWGAAAAIREREGATARRVLRAVGAGVAATTTLGLVDLWFRSPIYLRALGGEVGALFGGLVVAVVAGAAAIALRHRVAESVNRVWTRIGRPVAVLGGVVIVAASLLAFARPLLQTVRYSEPIPYLAEIEKQQGLPIDGTRIFTEHSLRWQGWYVGFSALAAGVGGWAWSVGRVLRGHFFQLVPFLLLFSALTVLYLWKPSITPDHIWAMRRFLPLTIPGLLLLAGWAASELWARGLLAQGLALAIGAALIVYPLRALGPVLTHRDQAGMLDTTERVCETVGADGAIVFRGYRALLYTQGLRGFCGIPVAMVPEDASREELIDLSERWSRHGRTLWLAGALSTSITAALPDATPIALRSSNSQFLEQTLDRPPSRLITVPFEIWLAPVAPV